ncbi:MAG: hypothetical protein KC910_37140 [Candidatus Eremiobacteraeota bacterium]|nr:hypothetical protein [Candidatus Eremiobacteraeota bacterium]
MTSKLLRELARPSKVSELAGRLGEEADFLRSFLTVLESSGYVGRAYDRSPTCSSGCGGCAVANLCPARGSQTDLEVWRLTEKGRKAAERDDLRHTGAVKQLPTS